MRSCQRTSPKISTMRVGLAFDLTPGAASDLLTASLLMNLLSELTAAGLPADHISVTIDNYRATDTPLTAARSNHQNPRRGHVHDAQTQHPQGFSSRASR